MELLGDTFMRQHAKRLLLLLLVCLGMLIGAPGQTRKPEAPDKTEDKTDQRETASSKEKSAGKGQEATPESPDLTKQPTLYVVGYAHLDTQWRWDYVQTIRDHIPKTMHQNFELFEKYPNYIFN